MKKITRWVLAATLVCGASVFTACSDDDDPAAEKGQLLEVYDVQGSAGKAPADTLFAGHRARY